MVEEADEEAPNDDHLGDDVEMVYCSLDMVKNVMMATTKTMTDVATPVVWRIGLRMMTILQKINLRVVSSKLLESSKMPVYMMT